MSQYFPAVLQGELIAEFGITYTEFNLLYSIQSIPNVVIALFGGVFVSKVGAPLATVFLSFVKLAASGACLEAVASKNFRMLVAGRFVYGLTIDSQGIAQSVIIAKWFAPSG